MRLKELFSTLFFTLLFLWTHSGFAFNWQDLWVNKDQQAAVLLQQGKATQAAELFQNPAWQAVANYRAGNYKTAQQQFANDDTSNGFYNKGNTLAQQGQYQAAIEAYNQALKRDPHNQDATINRDLLKKLLQQQNPSEGSNNTSHQQNNSDAPHQANSQQNNSDAPRQTSSQQNHSDASHQANPQQNNSDGNDAKQQQQNHSNSNKSAQHQNHSTSNQAQNSTLNKSIASQEQQRANEQALKQINDDPGSLLRQKFLRDYYKRHPEAEEH